MRGTLCECSLGPPGFLVVVLATMLMTVSAVSLHDGNVPKSSHYEVEEPPHIEYNYVVYNLVPKEGVWWKRGTHRMRHDKVNMAPANDGDNGVAAHSVIIVKTS